MDFRNPSVVRQKGMSALLKELGAVGTTYFIRQFDFGKGDYTAERDELLAGITIDEIIETVRGMEHEIS
jgi:hypothetical protein